MADESNQGEGNREADRRYRKGVRKTVARTTEEEREEKARSLTEAEREEAERAGNSCEPSAQMPPDTGKDSDPERIGHLRSYECALIKDVHDRATRRNMSVDIVIATLPDWVDSSLHWTFDAIRRKTAQGPYEAVNYHRFADDIVITVSGHTTKRGWAERALQRVREQFALIGVELNQEKTKVVDTLKGEAFGFLGFDLRRVRRRNGNGYFILITPKKKARKAVKAKIRYIIGRGGATPMPEMVKRINATLAGWVNYFRVGNSSRAFSEVRDYVEMKVRTLLTRRKRRRR